METKRTKCTSCKRSAPEFICKTCFRSFKQCQHLITHINKLYPCKPKKFEDNNNNACSTCLRYFPEFTCNKCGISYKYEIYLLRHLDSK